MREIEHEFVVICRDELHGRHLREMLEFLDVLPVSVVGIQDGQRYAGEPSPIAVFLCSDLAPVDIDQVVAGVGNIEANTPIVIFADSDGSAVQRARSTFPWANIFEVNFPDDASLRRVGHENERTLPEQTATD
jgi:hypothetical protein